MPSCKKVEVISKKCYTTKNYFLHLKLFKQNLSINITIIYKQNFLDSIKLKGLLTKNTVSQILKKMLKLTLKAAMFVWHQKR